MPHLRGVPQWAHHSLSRAIKGQAYYKACWNWNRHEGASCPCPPHRSGLIVAHHFPEHLLLPNWS